MATATAINPAAWQTRAKELCDAAQLKYTARYLHTEQAFEVFAVPTRDRSGEHTVTHDLLTGAVRCDCKAGSFERACAHAGAVIVYCEAREFAFSEAGRRGQRQYEAFCDELERRVTSLPIARYGPCEMCGAEGPVTSMTVPDGAGAWDTMQVCDGHGCDESNVLDLTA